MSRERADSSAAPALSVRANVGLRVIGVASILVALAGLGLDAVGLIAFGSGDLTSMPVAEADFSWPFVAMWALTTLLNLALVFFGVEFIRLRLRHWRAFATMNAAELVYGIGVLAICRSGLISPRLPAAAAFAHAGLLPQFASAFVLWAPAVVALLRPRTANARAYRAVSVGVLLAAILSVGLVVSFFSREKYAAFADQLSLVHAIEDAEERYKLAHGSYLSVSSSVDSLYPALVSPETENGRASVERADTDSWKRLGLVPRSSFDVSVAVVAGGPGEGPPVVRWCKGLPAWSRPTEPWYVIAARGSKRDGNICVVSSPLLTLQLYKGTTQ